MNTADLFSEEREAMKDVRQAGAIFSADGVHRYSLTRGCSFVPAGKRVPAPYLLWLMLNGSTANEDTDDQTIRKVRAFTRGWAPVLPFGGFMVGNIYSFRARDPKRLQGLALDQLRGRGWCPRLLEMIEACSAVVAAWGDRARVEDTRQVLAMVRRARRPVFALRLTERGAPSHPLYIPLRIQPSIWTGAYLDLPRPGESLDQLTGA